MGRASDRDAPPVLWPGHGAHHHRDRLHFVERILGVLQRCLADAVLWRYPVDTAFCRQALWHLALGDGNPADVRGCDGCCIALWLGSGDLLTRVSIAYVEAVAETEPGDAGWHSDHCLRLLCPAFRHATACKNYLPNLSGFNALSPGIVMGFMITPMIASLSEDALSAVSNDLREGAYALGAGRASTIFRVILPAARSGIAAASLLALARAVGETMIVAIAQVSSLGLPLIPRFRWKP